MEFPYYIYSDFLREKYGEKVYKLPVNIPVTCPNRDGTKGTGGCIFCGENGAGFESLDSEMSVAEQIKANMEYIGRKYKAKKFIAYFQNFSNTYLPLDRFEGYMREACVPNVVQIDVSTRPDCVGAEYLEVLKAISVENGVNIGMELGLQSANEDTLKILNRGHSVDDFVKSAEAVKAYGFELCAHVILDLPWDCMDDVVNTARLISDCGADSVKLHSLYVVKGTELERMALSGEVKLLTAEDYIERAIAFLEHLRGDMAVQRIIGRAPEDDAPTANFGVSWWRIKEEIEARMAREGRIQGGLMSIK